MWRMTATAAIAVAATLVPVTGYSSYGLYIGKNLTADDSVLLGGTGDEVSGHWVSIIPRREHEPDATIEVGVTEDAAIPGELIDIPQARTTYKLIGHEYSNYEGFPPPLINGGLNEYQVAARDIWSPSREELVEMTERPQKGLNYSDLSRIALQRAHTAEEAVEVTAGLIDEHGYATYGGNSHLFADPEEGWVFIDFAGSRGLWVAERLGPDEVRMSYPGYVNPIPREHIDFEKMELKENAEYRASDNFIAFAVERGWYDPASGDPFDVNEIYGSGTGRDISLYKTSGQKVVNPVTGDEVTDTRVSGFEERMRDLAPVTLEEMMELVRTPLLSGDSSGYGQVARLQGDLGHRELATLWMAPTGSVTAPFVPFYIGTNEVPIEYAKHRYLYRGADSTFVTRDWQIQEGTDFAFRVFKQLMYFTCDRPGQFLPGVRATLEGYERTAMNEQERIRDIASTLIEAENGKRAEQYLTGYTARKADQALEMGMGLVSGLQARTKAQHGLRRPETGEVQNLNYSMVTCLVTEE